MSSPLVSIVLPTYNGERYLAKQLDSIYSQSCQDFEVIVADDVSTDGTVKVLDKYKQHNNFQYSINQKNLGFIKNFSQAVMKARGKFIAPCDQDDIWHAHKLQTLIDNAGEHLLVYSNSELIDENDQPLGRSLKDSLKINFVSGNPYRAFYYANCVAAHTMLFRRELIDYINDMPESVYHDHWLAFIASRLGTIQAIDEKLVQYRRHDSNVTVSVKKKKITGNIFSYLKEKADRQSQRNKDKLLKLRDFQSFLIRVDHSDALLDSLIEEYGKFDTVFFNRRIHSILKQRQEEFFAISRKGKTGLVMEECMGRKFYQYIPIT